MEAGSTTFMLSALVKPADAMLCVGFLFCFGGCHLYTPFLFCSGQQAPSSGCSLPHSRASPSPGGELLHVSAPTQGCPLDHLACIPGPRETINSGETVLGRLPSPQHCTETETQAEIHPVLRLLVQEPWPEGQASNLAQS